MSHVVTAHFGQYTLEVDDSTNNAPDVGQVQMTPITVPWGQKTRTSRRGIRPVEFSVLAKDPRGKLQDALTGNISEDDFDVTLKGPSGPTGLDFRLDLLPKSRKATDPVATREYPERTRITFYDGLTRFKSVDRSPYDKASLNRISLQEAITSAFNSIQTSLDIFLDLATTVTTGGSSNIDGNDDIGQIQYAFREEEGFETWWDVLKDLSERFHLQIFQDPFDRGSNGKAQWKIIPQDRLGRPVQGVSISSGVTSSDTLTTDEITLPYESFESQNGEEYESAITFGINNPLPSEAKTAEEIALVVDGVDTLRDGSFYYKNRNTDEPLYGTTRYGQVAQPDVELRPQDTPGQSNDDYWESGLFDVGTGTKRIRLTYSLTQTSGDTGEDRINVYLRLVDDDGSIIVSSTGGLGTDLTLDLDTQKSGRVQVRAEATYDTDSTIRALFGSATLKVYRTDRRRVAGDPTEFDTVSHAVNGAGTLTQSVGPKFDLIAPHPFTDRPDKTDNAIPVSIYTSTETNAVAYSAGEYMALRRQEISKPDAQTLKTTLDRVIGPNTRIKVQDESGTIVRTLVMGGGRTVDLKNSKTEIADITL